MDATSHYLGHNSEHIFHVLPRALLRVGSVFQGPGSTICALDLIGGFSGRLAKDMLDSPVMVMVVVVVVVVVVVTMLMMIMTMAMIMMTIKLVSPSGPACVLR